MNDSSNTISTTEKRPEDGTARVRTEDRSGVFLPGAIYESLPVAYVSVGVLIVLGALYIGFSHLQTLGYLAVGVSTILAGLMVRNVRRRKRSKAAKALA